MMKKGKEGKKRKGIDPKREKREREEKKRGRKGGKAREEEKRIGPHPGDVSRSSRHQQKSRRISIG
ncbi:uncharacterized protein BO66DRAFT_395788 [Aspergillus aculeatinus CBS 121060]|uniref:Uncharacterized protein n=1 Tax=Aspergillus aculeatinus CBS 121060 TaxID=1448322 RepID=A0ACD1GUA3_9EURO|nr:hypothetical protein BO66DRAFT_395788 [Aspergillus aculeatinus CBS 121060]RAH65038.1 hypothetical protein BO66DRAFT_395788 [Aspergillus aculeatinus CBS 121060]